MSELKDSRVFDFDISHNVQLSVSDIWPDGDAPDNPTAKNVAEVVRKSGRLSKVLRDWDLLQDLTLTISGGGEVVEVVE